MKIYTKTGDAGDTGLYGGGRVSKDHPRIEAYGTVDELNALVGHARAEQLPAEIDAVLGRVQNELFDLGAELATLDPRSRGTAALGGEQIARLERAIDEFDGRLAPLRQFILPGGTRGAAALHVCRTVCRRAERRVVGLRGKGDGAETAGQQEPVRSEVIVYLNRLGDLLFVLARAANAAAGLPDVPWQREPGTT